MLVLQQIVIDILLDEKHIILGKGDLARLVANSLSRVLPALVPVILGDLVQTLRAIRTDIVGFPQIKKTVGSVADRQVTLAHLKQRVPNFLHPSTNLHALLVPLDRLILLAQVAETVGNIEMVAGIVGLLFQALLEEADVALKLVGLAAAVANVVNAKHIFSPATLLRSRREIVVLVGR